MLTRRPRVASRASVYSRARRTASWTACGALRGGRGIRPGPPPWTALCQCARPPFRPRRVRSPHRRRGSWLPRRCGCPGRWPSRAPTARDAHLRTPGAPLPSVAVVVPNLKAAFSLVRRRAGDSVGVVACRVVTPREVADAVDRRAAGTARTRTSFITPDAGVIRPLMQQNDNFAVGTGPGTPHLRLLAEHVSKGLSDRWAAVRVRSAGRLPGSPRLAPCQTPRRRTDRHTRAAVEEEGVLQVPRILRVVVGACQNAVTVGEQVVPATLGHHFGRRRLHSPIGGVRRVRGRFVGSGPVGVRQAALNVLPPGAQFRRDAGHVLLDGSGGTGTGSGRCPGWWRCGRAALRIPVRGATAGFRSRGVPGRRDVGTPSSRRRCWQRAASPVAPSPVKPRAASARCAAASSGDEQVKASSGVAVSVTS